MVSACLYTDAVSHTMGCQLPHLPGQRPAHHKEVLGRRVDIFDPVLHVAEVSFAGIHVADSDRLSADTERAHHVALMGMAITMVGACQRILDLVVEHAKSRQQFGVAIGTFQAV